jgi:hypothetical protein
MSAKDRGYSTHLCRFAELQLERYIVTLHICNLELVNIRAVDTIFW